MNFADENGYLEIVIYVVVMVVGLAASAYRNYVKRKQQQQQPADQGMPGFPETEFDTIIDSDEEIEEEIVEEPLETVEFPVQEEYEEVEEFILPEQLINEKKSQKEGEAVFESTDDELVSDDYFEDKHKNLSEVIEEISDKETEKEEKSEPFDLKKAIIYSEIMSTKYF